MLQIGDKLPNIVLRNDRNRLVDLTKLAQERLLVVFFYPRDYVPGSTKESCIFRDNYKAFIDLGAEVVGISSDTVDAHRTFKENFSLPFILLSDENNLARAAFGVPKSFGMIPGRATFVIDNNSIIRMGLFDQFHVPLHIFESLIVIKKLSTKKKGE